MDDLRTVVSSLHSKVEKLIHLHKSSEDEITKLLIENNELKTVINQQEEQILGLQEKNKVIKIASSLSGSAPEEKTTGMKLKINELVREIDNCIALLNK